MPTQVDSHRMNYFNLISRKRKAEIFKICPSLEGKKIAPVPPNSTNVVGKKVLYVNVTSGGVVVMWVKIISTSEYLWEVKILQIFYRTKLVQKTGKAIYFFDKFKKGNAFFTEIRFLHGIKRES